MLCEAAVYEMRRSQTLADTLPLTFCLLSVHTCTQGTRGAVIYRDTGGRCGMAGMGKGVMKC